jgi:aspartyl/asparaginyl beta-hydroxylase (cupin superfamily)
MLKSSVPAMKAMNDILWLNVVQKLLTDWPRIERSLRPVKPSMSQITQASAQNEVITGGSPQGSGWAKSKGKKAKRKKDSNKGRKTITKERLYGLKPRSSVRVKGRVFGDENPSPLLRISL